MKKRLKIKNLILTFIFAIIGLFIVSNSKIEATNFPNSIVTYNENIPLVNDDLGYIVINNVNNDFIVNGYYYFVNSTVTIKNCVLSFDTNYNILTCQIMYLNDLSNGTFNNIPIEQEIYIYNNYIELDGETFMPLPTGASEEDLEEAYNEGYQAGITSSDSYQEGYDKGYEDGYLANNTIPNIYIQSANLIFNTGYFPLQISITDYINNLNGRLDFTALYNYDFTGSPNQIMSADIVLNTPISINDTLKFDLVDNSTLSNSLWVILGNTNNSCNISQYGTNCIYLEYSDLVNNNYLITPSTLYPNINISEFNYIQLSFDYKNNMLYGIKSIIDTTMASTTETEYDIGYNVGYIVGKNEGMLLGRTEAYNLGYEAGLDYQFTNENTITGMMGTLFTMPINMFKTIFNFEFLGVNLAGFFLSLVTLLVVIWLVRKFI